MSRDHEGAEISPCEAPLLPRSRLESFAGSLCSSSAQTQLYSVSAAFYRLGVERFEATSSISADCCDMC